MHRGRRQFLSALGASGVAFVTGCLRLEESQSTAGDGESQPDATAPEPDFRVSVVGRKFSWEFGYPAFDVSERAELVLPVDTTAALEVKSDDVLHGFHVSELNVMVDALPDEQSKTTVTPEKTGQYTAYCTEYCGEGHSDMKAPVRVVSEPEFEEWRS
jgi:cytochrome c oxidase subunit 2